MGEIQRIGPADYERYITIVANAYPDFGLHKPEERERFLRRFETQPGDTHRGYFGYYRDGALLGGMGIQVFDMNLRGAQVPIGGVGLVAVDIYHKKEHVARDLIRSFLDYCREQGAPFAALYAFRPDFYKQMGFGYGTRMSQYHVPPTSLPATGDRTRVSPLSADDQPALRDCYNRVAAATHGLFQKPASAFARIFQNAETRVAGYRNPQTNGLEGYITFSYGDAVGDQIMHYEMKVHDLVYEHRDALLGLLAFLRTQYDQVTRIEFNTQDESFIYLLGDPRDGTYRVIPFIAHQSNVQGMGIMYRVVDAARAFALLRDVDFGGQNLTLRITLRDSFLPENEGPTLVRFTDGHPEVLPAGDANADAAITLDVAEFSALLMGCVDFAALHTYGLADISDPAYIEPVTRLFAVPRKPVCTTPF